MGDISEMRGLLVVASVIIIMVSMLIIIPPSVYESNLRNSETAGIINPVNQLSWNSSLTVNLTHAVGFAGWQDTFRLNGFNYIITTYESGQYATSQTIKLQTCAELGDFLIIWAEESMIWYDTDNKIVSLSSEVIETSIIDDYATPAQFTLQNGQTSITATCVYDNTTYSSFDDALTNDAASLVFETELDYTNSNLNAFQLIGMLYTASLPGLDPLINYLITIPLWIATIYLAFIFILRLTGALFGGGA